MQRRVGSVLAPAISLSSYEPCLIDAEGLVLESSNLSGSYTFSDSSVGFRGGWEGAIPLRAICSKDSLSL